MVKHSNNPYSIGRRIRECRERVKLTQQDVGILSGVSAPTVSRIETGHVNEIGYGILVAIAEGLDVSLGYLLCIIDEIRTFSGKPYLY